jgi:hypothetical protein
MPTKTKNTINRATATNKNDIDIKIVLDAVKQVKRRAKKRSVAPPPQPDMVNQVTIAGPDQASIPPPAPSYRNQMYYSNRPYLVPPQTVEPSQENIPPELAQNYDTFNQQRSAYLQDLQEQYLQAQGGSPSAPAPEDDRLSEFSAMTEPTAIGPRDIEERGFVNPMFDATTPATPIAALSPVLQQRIDSVLKSYFGSSTTPQDLDEAKRALFPPGMTDEEAASLMDNMESRITPATASMMNSPGNADIAEYQTNQNNWREDLMPQIADILQAYYGEMSPEDLQSMLDSHLPYGSTRRDAEQFLNFMMQRLPTDDRSVGISYPTPDEAAPGPSNPTLYTRMKTRQNEQDAKRGATRAAVGKTPAPPNPRYR